MTPGTTVYAGRRPQGSDREWAGVVLADDDPVAWAGTIRFGARVPDQDEINEFLKTIDPDPKRVPVAWEFGTVYREPVVKLRECDDRRLSVLDVRFTENTRGELVPVVRLREEVP